MASHVEIGNEGWAFECIYSGLLSSQLDLNQRTKLLYKLNFVS